MNYPLFSLSFRPFFILCALVATFNPILWTLEYVGLMEITTIFSSSLAWHGHEMLFGFTSALMCGFLLTASYNWTGRGPIQGIWLLLLTFFYLVERITPFLGLTPEFSFILMTPFSLLFLGCLIYNLYGNRNQWVMTPILILFSFAKFTYLVGELFEIDGISEHSVHFGMMSFLLMIVTFSGRVIPMFSARHLGHKPKVPTWVDKGAIFSLWPLLVPDQYLINELRIILILNAVLFNSLRLYYWEALKCLRYPLISVLHMGQTLIILGLLVKIVEIYYPTISMTQIPLHIFTVGTLGIFSIGIMIRVSKGHTGRMMAHEKLDRIIFHMMYLCAFLRILPFIYDGELQVHILGTAAIFWTLCYLLFLIKWAPRLIAPRVDS